MSNFLALGRKQAALFMNNNIGYMELLVTAECPREILNVCYRILVREGKLKELKDLPIEEKTSIWETAKEFSKDRLDQKGLISLSYALQALNYLI
jgi:hypothetical protein